MNWSIGFFMLIFGVLTLINAPDIIVGLIFIGVGLLLLVFSGAPLNIIADRTRGILTLEYNYLLFKRTKEFALSEVSEIVVQEARGSRGGTTYRLALRTEEGSVVPFRLAHSSGRGGKYKIANQLNEFLGLTETGGLLETQAPGRLVEQELLDQSDEVQSGQTDGVNWQVDYDSIGSVFVTRWLSTDFQYPGQFLLLAQKPPGSSNLLGDQRGILGGVSKLLYRKLMEMYGISEDEMLGLEKATSLEGLSSEFERHFTTLASDPISARRLLNPWVVRPLVDWALRNPVQQGQSLQGGESLQLLVLFSPLGVRLSLMNAVTEEQEQELCALGVEMTKAAQSYSSNLLR